MPVETRAQRSRRLNDGTGASEYNPNVVGQEANLQAPDEHGALNGSLELEDVASNPRPTTSLSVATAELNTLGETAFDDENADENTDENADENANLNIGRHYSFMEIELGNTEPLRRATKRLQQELKSFALDPLENCTVELEDNNIFCWNATFHGPAGTPYENGVFHVTILFPLNFPTDPPQVDFDTKIYHCNISPYGSVCMDILSDKWTPILTVPKILLSLQVLLASPNPDDPYNYAVALCYKNNLSQHDDEARKWTQRYAMLKQPE